MSFFKEFASSKSAERRLLLRQNDIELYQLSHYHYLCSGDHIVQGAMDTLAPSQIQSPVVDAMLAGLNLSLPLDSVLNLGLGCAAIERYLDANYPKLLVTTVDYSQDVIEMCTQAKLLPSGCTPVLNDAAQFLEQTAARFDAVFCDLAIGKNQPEMLCSEVFYRACQKCMTAGAVLIVNVLCADNQALRKVCLAARKAFAWTALVEVPGFDNVVMYAAGAPPASDIDQPRDAFEIESKTPLSRARILP